MTRLTDTDLADIATRIDKGECHQCDGDRFIEVDAEQNEVLCGTCEGTGAFSLSTATAKTIVAELQHQRTGIRALKRIRARITTLSLAKNLPPMVWSELCLLDTDLAALIAEMERTDG